MSSRLRRIIPLTVFTLLSSLAMRCGGGSDGGGPTEPPDDPNPPANTVTITVVSRNVDATADAGQVYAYVGDAGLTRAQMPANLNENAPLIRYMPGTTQLTATLNVPRGKVVTLFAVEFDANGSAVDQTGTPIPTQAPRNYIEFVSWNGQTANVEAGVVTVLADANKTVTATFDRVPSVVFNIIGCINFKAQNTHPGLLSFGRVVQDTPPDTSSNGFSGVLGGQLSVARDYNLFWGKTGSIITLRARITEDRSPSVLRSGFIRWDGSAALCGTSLSCQIALPARSNTVGPMRMVNGWAVRQGVQGCNCNPLTPEIPCTMFP